MKQCLAVTVVLCLLSPSSAAAMNGVIHRVGELFGPHQCVSVTRSSEGSCVITLDCQGLDTSQTEFAYDCVGKSTVRHSFGFGGFEADEEFDTGKSCDQCNAPAPVDAIAPLKHVEEPVAAKKPVPKAVAKPVNMVQPLQPARKEADVQPPKLTLSKADVKPLEHPSKVKHGVIEHVKHGKPVKLHVEVEDSQQSGTKDNPWPTKEQQQVQQESAVKDTYGDSSNPWPTKEQQQVQQESAVKDTYGQPWFEIWGSSTPEEKMHKKESVGSSPESVKYGPNGCVSVYKDRENHCIMSTSCGGSNMTNYEYGLVCVDKVGLPVKHLFGKDSFDSEESFDTLIRCNECLGLEDVPGGVALSGEVSVLKKAISGLGAAMKNISMNLGRLNAVVFKNTTAPSPAPAAAPPAAAAAAAAPTKFLRKPSTHHMHSKTKKHSRHVEELHRHSKQEKHLTHSHSRHHAHHVSRHAAESDDDVDHDDGFD